MAGYKTTLKNNLFLYTTEKKFFITFKLIYIDRNQASGSWGWGEVRGKGWEGRGAKEHKKTPGVDMITILIMMMVVYSYQITITGVYNYKMVIKMCIYCMLIIPQ